MPHDIIRHTPSFISASKKMFDQEDDSHSSFNQSFQSLN
jgi:hypothetical protein